MAPLDKDLVVTREGDLRYTVRQFPGVPQLPSSSRKEALKLARDLAQEEAVDLWYAADGTYRLLEAYRAGAVAHAFVRQPDGE